MARPTILGVEGYAAQFLRKANAGICIEPENADQLAEAVLSLADDPSCVVRWDRLATNTRGKILISTISLMTTCAR